MALEIERKWLIKPDKKDEFLAQLYADSFKNKEIIIEKILQVYISKSSDYEMRIRKIKTLNTKLTSYSKAEKWGRGLAREELEIDIDEETFRELFKQNIGFLHKIRYKVDGMDIDLFQTGTLTLEIEFNSKDEAMAFEIESIPHIAMYIKKEVTGDKRYSNFTVAKIQSAL